MAKASKSIFGKNANICIKPINKEIPKIPNINISTKEHNFFEDFIKTKSEDTNIQNTLTAFKTYIFKEIDFLNTYFNSILLPIIKEKNSTLKEIAKRELVKIQEKCKNEEQHKNDDKISVLKKIINCSGDFDFYSKVFCGVFEEYYKNNKKYFNEKLNFEFLLFPDILKTNFSEILKTLTGFRHFIQHSDKKCLCPKSKDILNSLLILLPQQRIEELYNQISKTYKKVKNKIEIKDNLINEFDANDKNYLKTYKDNYKERIKAIYLKYLSKDFAREQTEGLNNKEKSKVLKRSFRERKRILLGEYKYKDEKDKKLKNGITDWKKIYILSRENYSYVDHFYKITTFKRIYNYISGDIIKKIIKLFKQKLEEYNINDYKIQFSYIEDFYFANLKINFLINKYLEIIKIKNENLLNKEGKFENKILRNIRNCIAHNNLFYFMKNECSDDITTKEVINKILEVLENIEPNLKNDFLLSYKTILFNLKIPDVYNKDGNKVKSSNTTKLKKYLKHKDEHFKIDGKRILVLIANELAFEQDGKIVKNNDKIFYKSNKKA